MITIQKPFITRDNGKSRLHAEVSIDNETKDIWFEVDNQFEKFLTWERSDAFLIGILHFAMKEGHNIKCECSISEDLYYQIDRYLIDAIHNSSPNMHRIDIDAELDNSQIESENAVGTGISCGVDSLHTIAQHSDSKYKQHNITHLAFNNVGSHGTGEESQKLFIERRNLAKSFAEEYGYTFVESNSNIHNAITQNHLFTHAYTDCFAIYCLRKLYSIYYYASSHEFWEFSLRNIESSSSSYYELLLLDCFSVNHLKIYSEGANETRLKKTDVVSRFSPSYKYLNVCLKSIQNCNVCPKCVRTLVCLDALNVLEKYHDVFDIEYYKKHRQKYYLQLIVYTMKKDPMFIGVFQKLKSNIHLITYIKAPFAYTFFSIRSFLAKRLPAQIKLQIKRFLQKKHINII